MRQYIWIFVFAFAVPSLLWADSTVISKDAGVSHVQINDFDGDGSADIALQVGHTLQIFEGNPIPTSPTRELTLPAWAYLWCVEPATEGRAARIWVQGTPGIDLVPSSTEDGKLLYPGTTVFAGESTSSPVFKSFLFQANDDDHLDLVRLKGNDIVIYSADGQGGFSKGESIPLHPYTRIQSTESERRMATETDQVQAPVLETVIVPEFGFERLRNSESRDFYTFQFRELRIASSGDEPGYGPLSEPILLSEKERKNRDRYFEYEITPFFEDLNGDGLTDIVSAYPGRGKIFIYLNEKNIEPGRAPDHTRQIDGWITHIWMDDVNGDGRKDLLMAGVEKFGVVGGLRLLLTQEVDLKFFVFLADKDGVPANRASLQRSFTIPFSISLSRSSSNISLPFEPNFAADVNGDGLRDLLVKTDATTLGVFHGTKEKIFSEEPARSISIADSNTYESTVPFVADLNGDGNDDLVLHHTDWDTNKHAVEVIYSPAK